MSVPRLRPTGFTLVGLLVAMGVLAVLAGLAIPAWQRQVERHRLSAGLTAAYGVLVGARHEAIFLNRRLNVVYRPEGGGLGWCLALSADPACDCRSGDCSLPSGRQRAVRALDFPGLTLKVLPRNGRIRFYPARGTTSAGSIEMRYGGSVAKVVVSSLGRIRVCSSAIAGYPPCR